jgi:hypothetical protein
MKQMAMKSKKIPMKAKKMTMKSKRIPMKAKKMTVEKGRKTVTATPTGQWEYSYKTWPMSGNNGWRLVAIHHEFRGNKVVEIWGRPV